MNRMVEFELFMGIPCGGPETLEWFRGTGNLRPVMVNANEISFVGPEFIESRGGFSYTRIWWGPKDLHVLGTYAEVKAKLLPEATPYGLDCGKPVGTELANKILEELRNYPGRIPHDGWTKIVSGVLVSEGVAIENRKEGMQHD